MRNPSIENSLSVLRVFETSRPGLLEAAQIKSSFHESPRLLTGDAAEVTMQVPLPVAARHLLCGEWHALLGLVVSPMLHPPEPEQSVPHRACSVLWRLGSVTREDSPAVARWP